MARSTLLLGTLIAIVLSPTARAAEIVRDTALLASMPIQGVSFDMLPREAFERLRAEGYRAGSIDTYDAWHDEGIEFVKGPYGGAEGFSSVTFARRNERITRIAESLRATAVRSGRVLSDNRSLSPLLDALETGLAVNAV